MKFVRLSLMMLLSMITVLIMVQTASAAKPGKGGEGSGAAVLIDFIRLEDAPPQGGEIIAEIAGGGFLGGSHPVEVTLGNSAPLAVVVDSAELLFVTLPAELTTDGDHVVRVSTGDSNKESDTATIRLGGEMIVSCISWFVSGPADEHIHTEVHVEDTQGNAVIGATVTWSATNPSGVSYQTNSSLTHDKDGHASELLTCPTDPATGEALVSGSGVTDWFCCIGAGKFDKDGPPGKRSCEAGTYTASIGSVAAPLFTNMVWDEDNDANELDVDFELVR